MLNKTKFVTFYSYKGGVGRTLALANTAYYYAMNGKRVVIIDFDLEAPGISSVQDFKEHIKLHLNNQYKLGGLLELILAYKDSKNKMAGSLYDFYSTDPIKTSDFEKGGEIFIIPAGREDNNYYEKLKSFNWDDFFHNKGGNKFFSSLRDKIQFEFDNPDFVLIDSRTGLTDIGGICTLLLPDRVVLFTGLNKQNLKGTKLLIDSIEAYSKSEL